MITNHIETTKFNYGHAFTTTYISQKTETDSSDTASKSGYFEGFSTFIQVINQYGFIWVFTRFTN